MAGGTDWEKKARFSSVLIHTCVRVVACPGSVPLEHRELRHLPSFLPSFSLASNGTKGTFRGAALFNPHDGEPGAQRSGESPKDLQPVSDQIGT